MQHLQSLIKAENALQGESATANLNSHQIAFHGLLRLESRKSQQLLKPFDLDFVFLDHNIIIECSY
jgi:hypothetical protein